MVSRIKKTVSDRVSNVVVKFSDRNKVFRLSVKADVKTITIKGNKLTIE